MTKPILSIDRKLPANLFDPRRIASTSEVDRRFFPNGRIPLLLSAPTTLSAARLLSAGVDCDEHGAFVRQGAPINFEVLDEVLPVAARQVITPVLGDLIPCTSWGSNLAHLLTGRSWDELRRRTFLKTGIRCETCGTNQDLECHELWEYHEPLPEYLAKQACGLQRLVRLMALCADCHETHHLGLAEHRGRYEVASDRIRAYNRWSHAELNQYRGFLIDRYDRRCQWAWLLDVSCIAPASLIVSKKWQLQDDGFLCANTKTGQSQTVILGCAWWRDGVCYPPVSPLAAYLDEAPAITVEWKYIARQALGGALAYCPPGKPANVVIH
jgi:hypothetical protein